MLAFDEPISATSLPNINVLVSGLPLPVASRILSNGDRVVMLTLTSLLAPNTVHTISTRVRDRAGNAMGSTETRTFTTGPSVDLINVATTVTPSPASGATGVPVSVAPSLTFNEAIDPTTVIYGGNSGVTLLVAATGQAVPVTYSFSVDRRTVTMTPVSPLAAGTQYPNPGIVADDRRGGQLVPDNGAVPVYDTAVSGVRPTLTHRAATRLRASRTNGSRESSARSARNAR